LLSSRFCRQSPINSRVSQQLVCTIDLPLARIAATVRAVLAVLPRRLALFALGIWAWRAELFVSQQRVTLLGRSAWIGLVGGGAATLLTAGDVALGAAYAVVSDLAAIALALGYGALLLLLYERPGARRWRVLLAPLGRMALSNYLLQSLICGWIFYGYGLGRFGAMSSIHALILVIAIYLGQVLLSRVWLRRFRFGPAEWLWRTATSAARQPFLGGHAQPAIQRG